MRPIGVNSAFVCPRCGSLDVVLEAHSCTTATGQTYWALLLCRGCPLAPIRRGKRLDTGVVVPLSPQQYLSAIWAIQSF
jgi:hypothetical protein